MKLVGEAQEKGETLRSRIQEVQTDLIDKKGEERVKRKLDAFTEAFAELH